MIGDNEKLSLKITPHFYDGDMEDFFFSDKSRFDNHLL